MSTNWICLTFVCVFWGGGSKSGKHKVSFHTIPKIVSNQGQEHKERTRERRTCWIAAMSSIANESVVVTLFQEELQKIGTFSWPWEKNSSRSLKRMMVTQRKLEAKGLRNGGNASLSDKISKGLRKERSWIKVDFLFQRLTLPVTLRWLLVLLG